MSISLASTGNVHNAGRDININVTSYGSESSEKNNVAEWLFNIAMVNHYAIQNETLEKVSPGTASWILETPEFSDWIASESGTFWGVGIPGAGKTVLSSFVIHHIEERLRDQNNGGAVIFAYARFNDNLTVAKILAALLGQLVNHSPTISSRIGHTLYLPCVQKSIVPTEGTLVAHLQDTVAAMPSGVYIIIDALDELRDDVRERLLELLLSLHQPLFLTSRELFLPEVAAPTIQIRAPNKDFRKFITAELKRRPKLAALLRPPNRADVLDEVVEKITLKSDGMFLLAALQLAALGTCTTIKSLRKALESLPTKLTDMYDMTLQRIMIQEEEEHSLACKAILWIAYAYQPLQTRELLAALAVELDSTELDPDALTTEETLTSVCCGLLTIEKKTETVRLIYYTTYDFFKLQRMDHFQHPHTFIACISALYLQLANLNVQSVTEYSELDAYTKSYPLAKYVCMHLVKHIASASHEWNGHIPPYACHLFSANCFLPNQVSHYSSIDYGNIVHFTALYGIILPIFPETQCFSQHSFSGYTPLHYACMKSQASVVEWLLDISAVDVNARDKYGRTPLSVAASTGDAEVVKILLLLPGTDIHSKNIYGSTALHLACLNHSRLSAEALLKAPGIDVNVQDNHGATPLHEASYSNLGPIIRQLLSCSDVDVNVRDESGSTPLHYACIRRSSEAIWELLKHPDIRIDVQNQNGETPLTYL